MITYEFHNIFNNYSKADWPALNNAVLQIDGQFLQIVMM